MPDDEPIDPPDMDWVAVVGLCLLFPPFVLVALYYAYKEERRRVLAGRLMPVRANTPVGRRA